MCWEIRWKKLYFRTPNPTWNIQILQAEIRFSIRCLTNRFFGWAFQHGNRYELHRFGIIHFKKGTQRPPMDNNLQILSYKKWIFSYKIRVTSRQFKLHQNNKARKSTTCPYFKSNEFSCEINKTLKNLKFGNISYFNSYPLWSLNRI